MKAMFSSETSADFQRTTRRHVTELIITTVVGTSNPAVCFSITETNRLVFVREVIDLNYTKRINIPGGKLHGFLMLK
jgi:hypothetical protein